MALVRLQLRELLNQRGMDQGKPITLTEVSQATGIATNVLEKMIDNEGDQVSLKALAALCEYLECTPGDLFHYQPDPLEEDVIDVTAVVQSWHQQYGADEFPRA
jgi:DNA-binding Xre family transcriptional regulator